VPKPEELNEGSSLWNVYKFKEGFGGEISDSPGCYDLPVEGCAPPLVQARADLLPLVLQTKEQRVSIRPFSRQQSAVSEG
jgi:lipid II:glycine glycyltransferase (peptidoglycan interpeptide bridge formation enzyme)